MVEILEDFQSNGKHVMSCNECNTVFSYDDNDIHKKYYDVADWWGDDPYTYYVKCPKCGHNIILR